MERYKTKFIDMIIRNDALLFGEFTLKSGRVSPYFFNFGKLNDAQSLKAVGDAYATAIMDAQEENELEYDIIFGAAYKGIPIMAATICSLATLGSEKQFTFNRKEAKDHGEGGTLIGADIRGKRILIVDDVITAGTAIREVTTILNANNATLAGVVVSLDRQEKGKDTDQSAIFQVKRDFGVPVISVINRDNIVSYLNEFGQHSKAEAILEYAAVYGAQ